MLCNNARMYIVTHRQQATLLYWHVLKTCRSRAHMQCLLRVKLAPVEVVGTVKGVKSENKGNKNARDDNVPQAQHGERHCLAALFNCPGEQ